MKSGIHPFFIEISKYDTKVFIDAFSKLNYEVYKNRLDNGIPMLEINLRKYNIWNTNHPTLHLVHWTLRDIILYKARSLRFDNSCGILKNITIKQMIQIIFLYNNYENEQSKNQLNKDELFYTLFAIGEQQFPCQTNNYQFAIKRNRIMYGEINENMGKIFNLDEVFHNMLQMSYKEFEFILYIIMSTPITKNSIRLKEYPDGYFKELGSIEDIEAKYLRVIDYFTGDREKLNNIDFHLSRYVYPFFEIDGNNFLIDCFMMQDKLSDAVSWIARDYYKKRDDIYKNNHFPNKFGSIFEKYIKKIIFENVDDCKAYDLNDGEIETLIFNKKIGKRADFLIETLNYKIIIECKSGIKSIYSRDAYNNSLSLMKFLNKIFDEGAVQTLETINSLTPSEKQTVGVIVHYEEACLKTRVKYDYLKRVGKEHVNNILFIDITEFELFISIIKDNVKLAEEILSDYILASEKGDFMDLLSLMDNKAKNVISFLDNINLFPTEEYFVGIINNQE